MNIECQKFTVWNIECAWIHRAGLFKRYEQILPQGHKRLNVRSRLNFYFVRGARNGQNFLKWFLTRNVAAFLLNRRMDIFGIRKSKISCLVTSRYISFWLLLWLQRNYLNKWVVFCFKSFYWFINMTEISCDFLTNKQISLINSAQQL